ncbi:hypothetical protein GUJ93_ZPchr0012g20334 [Zizania palustris]|uniref:Uncharacterized protein n=1 Tax=Zizania palustris TaxID=103762 RepID=A0A8J6BX35_ZIZPA|nr:hypothetical protein GUJ93_ZPchr0012g20334 [Zizania palustris]
MLMLHTVPIGECWARTIASTRLQTSRPYFEFSDYTWPPGVTDLYPDHDQVTEYLSSYAKCFGVLVRVRFGCRVSALEYAGADEGELMAWEHWAGNGQAFGTGRGDGCLVGLEDHRPEAALQRVLARGQPAGSGADDHPLLLHSKSEGSTVCN